jgi:hypothetical protein
MIRILCLIVVICTLVAGCAPEGGGDAADIVEKYLQAKVDGDRDALAGLLCLDMEADLSREASSFASVSGIRIENMTCESGSGDVVQCSGEIVATYGSEDTTFPLTSYQVIQEDGECKWCGEAG